MVPVNQSINQEIDLIDFDSSSDEENEEDDFYSSDFDDDKIELDSDDSSFEYDPEGVPNDDDENGCHHWSRKKGHESQGEIVPDDNIPDNGCLLAPFDDDFKPHDVVEKMMDDTFILQCIDASNEHGAHAPNFVDKIGEITQDEKGISFIYGFFAIKWHLRLLKYPQ